MASCENETLQRLIAGKKELREKYPGALVITKMESESMIWGRKYKNVWYEESNGMEFFIASQKKKEWFETEGNAPKVLKLSRKASKQFRYT